VGFLLNCAYFRATKRFFPVQSFHQHDIEFIAQRWGLSAQHIDLRQYSKYTRIRHQQRIRAFYGFTLFDTAAQKKIGAELRSLVQAYLSPKQIFYRLVDVLINTKITPPSYVVLRTFIGEAITHHKAELIRTIQTVLPRSIRLLLDALLTKHQTKSGTFINRYQLTLLKRYPQSTKPAHIARSLADLKRLQVLHRRIVPTLQRLALGHAGIRYYAQSVLKSEIFQLTRRTDDDQYLHLLAFIMHQYYRRHDAMIEIIVKTVQGAVNTAQREHKAASYDRRESTTQLVQTLLSQWDDSFLTVLSTIEQIVQHPHWNDSQKVQQIKATLTRHQPTTQHTLDLLPPLREQVTRELADTSYYDVLEAKGRRLIRRLAPVVKALTFQAEPGAQAVMAALPVLDLPPRAFNANVPVAFLTPAEQRAVQGPDGRMRATLYKMLLLVHLMRCLKSGTINLLDSYKYRPLDDYLIPRTQWQHEKNRLLTRANLTAFADPLPVLTALNTTLQAQYATTNERVMTGLNERVQWSAAGTLRITTPKLVEQERETLQTFLPDRQDIALLEVLATVDRYSGFLEAFHHANHRHRRVPPARKTFFAGIIGLGCGIGTQKIARISRQLRPWELEQTVNWFFSPEATRLANDRVASLMTRLALPNIYRQTPDTLHTSSDGQKFEVRTDSLNANYSFKYFGKGKGVSVYSFIDERHILFYSTVISAAERESAYVLDGLLHNDVIESDLHSTDTHGYSEVIFGIMHLLGFTYAPRIRNLKHQRLYAFRQETRSPRTPNTIHPTGYINTTLLVEQWDDILRFVATIKLKETTASDLFRRLNSYSQQHALYRALKTFGQIIKSLFILRYLDDVALRQAIEKQLNKSESAHRFTRAISVGNPREFLEVDKHEQDMAEGCKRLIKNAIVCWNYLYLSQKLEEAGDSPYRDTLLHAIRHGSVVCWQHINLLGEYDFSEERLQDSVGIKPPKLIA
jgi:TnpA family transposase